jgi:hypothetical protein
MALLGDAVEPLLAGRAVRGNPRRWTANWRDRARSRLRTGQPVGAGDPRRQGSPTKASSAGAIGGPDLAGRTPRTLYRIASISKMMTTLGLMRLVEEASIDLDADVSAATSASRCAIRTSRTSAITLRHLLTHTSSLRDDAGYSWPAALRVPGAGRMAAKGSHVGQQCRAGRLFHLLQPRLGRDRHHHGTRHGRALRPPDAAPAAEPLGLQAGYNPAELPPAALANLATLYRKRTVDTEVWDADGPWIAQVDDYSAKAAGRRPASSATSSASMRRRSARPAACASRRATWAPSC